MKKGVSKETSKKYEINQQDDLKNDNIINENDKRSEKSIQKYFRESQVLDNHYDFGALVKSDEEINTPNNFLKEYKKQTKNVDLFYKRQLELNEAKYDKLLIDIQNKNKTTVILFQFTKN